MSDHSRRVSHLVRLEELNECLQWVLGHYSLERASWIVNRLTSHVQNGGASGIVVAATSMIDGEVPLAGPIRVDRERLCGVAIAIRQPGNSATLLAMQVAGDAAAGDAVAGDAAAGELMTPLIERLSQTGATFIQSGCDDQAQASILSQGGFEPLADLVMMSLEADRFAPAAELASGARPPNPTAHQPIQWFALDELGEDWRVHLNEVATRTFIETRDCPRLSDFRSPDDIVDGYVAAAHFDRRLACLMRVDGVFAGCLILTEHSGPPTETQPAETHTENGQPDHPESGAIELTYMGLVPEFRRRGLASELMSKTISQAMATGASRIVLAVDRENRRAAEMYQRLGWSDVIGETVWGRKI